MANAVSITPEVRPEFQHVFSEAMSAGEVSFVAGPVGLKNI